MKHILTKICKRMPKYWKHEDIPNAMTFCPGLIWFNNSHLRNDLMSAYSVCKHIIFLLQSF